MKTEFKEFLKSKMSIPEGAANAISSLAAKYANGELEKDNIAVPTIMKFVSQFAQANNMKTEEVVSKLKSDAPVDSTNSDIDAFKNWLIKNGYSEGTAKVYARWVRNNSADSAPAKSAQRAFEKYVLSKGDTAVQASGDTAILEKVERVLLEKRQALLNMQAEIKVKLEVIDYVLSLIRGDLN